MVQLLDGTGDLPAHRRHPPPGPHRRGGPPPGAELREHPKEIAEHVMLVDLARNDVGRVVEFGTEKVDELMTLERYSHVMHLTSQVSGDWPRARPSTCCGPRCPPAPCRGAEGAGHGDHRRARAGEARPLRRVVGYLDFSGNIDTAIAIRTMVVGDDGGGVGAGRGRHRGRQRPRARGPRVPQQGRALLAAVPAARRMTATADLERIPWRCIAVRGADVAPSAGSVAVPAWWGAGVDLLGPSPVPPPGVPEGSAGEYERSRILAGWPALGVEITESSIPAETGLADVAVSFTKGCYPGQELVERMDSRGSTAPRLLRRVVLPHAAGEAAGTPVRLDGAEVGRITSSSGDAALALISRSVAVPHDVVVALPGGDQPARLEAVNP
jgi:folate-binding protein YgfZ